MFSRPGFQLAPGSPVLAGKYTDTKEPGSYNATVTVSGFSLATGKRFSRKEMISVLVTP